MTDRRFSATDVAFGVLASWLVSVIFWTPFLPLAISPDSGFGSVWEVWFIAVLTDTVVVLPTVTLLGIPFAMWVERRLPERAHVYRPYVVAGAAVAVVFYLAVGRASFGPIVFVLIAGLAMLCAVAGRWGAGFWHERRLRRAAAVNGDVAR